MPQQKIFDFIMVNYHELIQKSMLKGLQLSKNHVKVLLMISYQRKQFKGISEVYF